MKKRKKIQIKNFQINLSNKTFYTFLSVIAIILLGVGVYASVDKTGAWHSSDDIEVSIDGAYKSLQEAIDAGDFGGEGGGESLWGLSGDNIYYNEGRVGIGTQTPSSTLSVLGSFALLRTSGTGIEPGQGPSFTLESPGFGVTTQADDYVRDDDAEDTCDGDRDVEYSCISGEGGKTCIDVVKLGASSGYYKRNIVCVADTDSYSLRTNAGTLEFSNTGGTPKITLSQGGNLDVKGKIIMEEQTSSSDSNDVVATKGYVDSIGDSACYWVYGDCGGRIAQCGAGEYVKAVITSNCAAGSRPSVMCCKFR